MAALGLLLGGTRAEGEGEEQGDRLLGVPRAGPRGPVSCSQFCGGIGSGMLVSAALLFVWAALGPEGALVRGGSASGPAAGGSLAGVQSDLRRMLVHPLVEARNSTSNFGTARVGSAISDGFWHAVGDAWEPASRVARRSTASAVPSMSATAAREPGSTASVSAAVAAGSAVVSTTTTQCMVPDEGDDCYSEVIENMYTIRSEPMAPHGGLNMWSSFEEVQDVLYSLYAANKSDSTCRKSCACETAHAGSGCHTSVAYILHQGVKEHPEWYPGLGEDATPEEFQSYLNKAVAEANCSRPCMAASWRGDPSLFCWTLAQGSGYEQDVMRSQLRLAAGIFGCDGFAVVSEDEWSVGRGPGGRIGEVRTVQFRGAEVGVSKDGTAGNAQLFMLAWKALLTRTTVLSFDWAVKADPDAVVVVDRLRGHLRGATGQKHFVRNCNKEKHNPEFPMMFGSLEAISKEGLKVYQEGMERCAAELPWDDWGEDVLMGKCLIFLGVHPVDDFSISSDGVCTGVSCHDPDAAAFHPFKSASAWVECWTTATASLGGPPPPLP